MNEKPIGYKEVYLELKKDVGRFSEQNIDKIFKRQLSEYESLSWVYKNLNESNIKDILKSAINLYSEYNKEISEKLKEADAKKSENCLVNFANELRAIRINKEAEPLRMKMTYCKDIYSWAIDKAKDKENFLFLLKPWDEVPWN